MFKAINVAHFREQIRSLIAQGSHFTWDNFSAKSALGYPQAPTAKWIAWTQHAANVAKSLGNDSEPRKHIINGLNVQVLGNNRDQFDKAKALILSGLNAALLIENDQSSTQFSSSTLLHVPVSKRVFVVHGHDEKAKNQLEILLHEFGLEPVVLHRQPDLGMTITEKFEKYSDVGYAFILLTPDDIAYPAIDDAKPDNKRRKETRARPNVIFEFGFFVRHLTRTRVCCLHTGGVVLPSDIQMVYKSFKENVEEIAHSIAKDLEAAGYQLRRVARKGD